MNRTPSVVALAIAACLVSTTTCADLASTVARVKPAIAIVGTYKATNSPRFALRGTGFVVAEGSQSQGNRLVTNAHVLVPPADADPEASLVVQLRTDNNSWQSRPAKVLEVDALHDLALLRFDGPASAAFKVRSSDTVQEGQSVAFMGFPIGGALGFSPVTHRALVSSIAPAALPTPTASQINPKLIRSVRSNSPFDIFQLDGTAYPGNSGGPLFDPDSGEVLGVVNMVLIKGTRESALSNPSGISYAVPSRYVLELLERNPGN
ncbi:serine protease [Rhodoferax sp. U11-2br]|uniref:S1 family peptidase n=1 Tax=Rhodoferax sp. U11-2br TaxID=2838878 RepID=UPI001BE6F384|nr:serine protease [Rhodoferax sp. U11-2br]MBT3067060.1 S1C family serine protease [Rhodoferax sp. U11-2br]